MRFTLSNLPAVLITCLPLYGWWYNYGLIRFTLALLFIALLRQIAVFLHIFRDKSDRNKMVLDATSSSHFVEKIRWTLDYLGADYEEEQNVSTLRALLTGETVPQLRVPATGTKIGDSNDIITFLLGKYGAESKQRRKFLSPHKEAKKLTELSDEIGEVVKKIAYPAAFKAPDLEAVALKIFGFHQTEMIPGVQRKAIELLVPLLIRYIKWKVGDEAGLDTAEENAEKLLDLLVTFDDLLKDGREFLLEGTTEPSVVDIHFASMLGPLLFNSNFGGKAVQEESKVTPDDLGPEGKKFMDQMLKKVNKRKSVKFAKEMFDKYRFRVLEGAAAKK